jgi:hypothetical protein
MLKIAGGVVLGFFGVFIAFTILISIFSDSHLPKNYSKATNMQLGMECGAAIRLKLKDHEKLNYQISNVTSMGFHNINIVILNITHPDYPDRLAMIGCKIKQTGENEFQTEIYSESYVGDMQK